MVPPDSSGDPFEELWPERPGAWEIEPSVAPPTWVTLAEAEDRSGASRSALRVWYRSGQVPSRLVEGPNGPQRLVLLDAVVERAGQSPRVQRRIAQNLTTEAELIFLRRRVDDLERRLSAVEESATDGP